MKIWEMAGLEVLLIQEIPWGEKLAVFIKFKNEILRPYGLRMTEKG